MNGLQRQWLVTRNPTLRGEVNRLKRSVTRRLNEWRNDQWSATLESLDPEDQSLWRITKRVIRVPSPSPLGYRGEPLTWTLRKPNPFPKKSETHFQPVTDPSVAAFIELVDVTLRSYFHTPTSVPTLTNSEEVHEAIRGLKVGKAPGPNSIPNNFEASSPASCIPPCPDIQRNSHPLLPFLVEARSCDLYP